MSAGWESAPLPGGKSLRYRRAGRGDTVLYLHSLLSPLGVDEFFAQLSEDFDVVMPLAPGFDELEELSAIDDCHDLALLYDDFLRWLGVGPSVCVVGHSLGGMVAAEVAAHFPERVAKLALVAPFGLWDDDDPVPDLARVPVSRLLELSGATTSHDGEAPKAASSEEVIALTRGMTASLKFLWPFPDRGLVSRLHRVNCPVRIYWGSDDPLNPPSYAQRMADALRGSEVEMRSGGHLLLQEEPLEMATRVAGFLSA